MRGVRRDTAAAETVHRIFNGHQPSIMERDMWIAQLPKMPLSLDIEAYLSKETTIASARIWNYNFIQTGVENGVKEMQVEISVLIPTSSFA
eukprot:SAG31_NODE_1182_length_9512_cov_3.773611_6_plen_91_part_00